MYRRQVADNYRAVRVPLAPLADRCHVFRIARDALYSNHPQSALTADQKASFTALPYFDYDPELRFLAEIDTGVERETFDVPLQADGLMQMTRLGRVRFELAGNTAALSLFWIEGYGGGIFLPFRGSTNGPDTYGGGRYLLDTIKGADLGHEAGKLVLDFNFAFNPSCAYNSSWHCPLAPTENWLNIPIRAGELKFPAAT